MKAGWEFKPLSEIGTLQRGFDLPKAQRTEGPFPLVTSSGLSDTHNVAKVKGPGVVTGRSGSIGNVFYVEKDFWPLNTALYVKDFHGNDPRFVHYLLQLIDLGRFASGAGVPTLNRNDVHGEVIAVPSSVEEQQRIVAVLDEAFEGLARARAHAEANLQNARELFENFLSGLMASKSDEWTTYNFGDRNVLQIIDGDRGANYPKKSDFMQEGHCLFLSTKNVRPDGFNFNETMFISLEKDRALRKGKLQARDVLLTTRGTIGNIAFFDETVPFEHIRINSGMLVLRPNEKLIRAEFLFELLRSSVIKEQIAEHVSGAAQPQLPIRSLVKFELPVPKSTAEQLHIVEQLKRLSDEVAILTERYSQSIRDIEELRQSLLQKAFAGELT
ncbi:restriction endonuclease subunit S [uncultured Hoeflea sp.]|uniref:restriction endonuclease subunit S n=1 Tax=uncultured Hoeflea sp. TaxID=538666 RepID=UPI0030DA9391